MSARRRNAWITGGLAGAACLTVAGILVILSSGTVRAPTSAPSADLELFAEKEKIRDQEWPPLNRAASLLALRIPDREGDADRLLLVKTLAEARGVKVLTAAFSPPRLTEDGSCSVAGLNATLLGEIDGIRAFLAAIERSERLVLVDGMSLSRAAEGVLVRADVRLRFPMRDPALDLSAFRAALREG